MDIMRNFRRSARWVNIIVSLNRLERCFGHSATVDEDKMYVFGGYSAGSITNKMYVLDLSILINTQIIPSNIL